ncbi:CCR4-NOT transcription complex subunit 2 isoform X7 [Lepeophtheirus salmonis]|uniref:CCR4-NOT transcription complex subunit 2 isoform X7 n=1 Tax=Lepeophtheirus salmonis TaxID=72036 RepID=UPI003AF3B685
MEVKMSSSTTTPTYLGLPPQHPPLGMGSLGNPSAVNSRSPLSRSSNSNSAFNSAVGGDRLFSGNRSSVSSNANNLGMNNNSLPPSNNVLPVRNPLFNRDRSKILSPNTFDPSEFPSLGNRDNAAPNPSLSARPNYGNYDEFSSNLIRNYKKEPPFFLVGMVKQPAMEASEFTMSNEDFPALPGYKPQSTSHLTGHHASGGPPGLNVPSSSLSLSGGLNNVQQQSTNKLNNASQGLFSSETTMGPSSSSTSTSDHSSSSTHQQQQQPRGIITTPDGMVRNIPPSMVTDQFGMIGLLTFIRAAETDPNLVSLALGAELTTLGLNLNSDVNLYPTFAGPWAETPCRPQDIDYHVPQEYLTNTAIRDKLAPVKLNRYKDDVLFYMFYTNVGDILQLAAAAELYTRDWRFHKDDRVWITRAPGMAPSEKTASYERGTYYFFDVGNWRKVPKDFHLDYDKLEDRPSLPTNLTTAAAGGPSSSTSSGSPAPPGAVGSLAAVSNGPSSTQSGIPSSGQPQHSPIAPVQSQQLSNDSRGGVSSLGAP